MTEGTKNTVIGSVLATVIAALLVGVGNLIHDQAEERVHSGKIDVAIVGINTVMVDQREILRDMQTRSGSVPPVIEAKLEELRNRINLQESRINDIEKRRQ